MLKRIVFVSYWFPKEGLTPSEEQMGNGKGEEGDRRRGGRENWGWYENEIEIL